MKSNITTTKSTPAPAIRSEGYASGMYCFVIRSVTEPTQSGRFIVE